MEIIIRKMRPEDIPSVAELEKEIFSEPWSENGFLSSLNSRDTLYLVVCENEKIIGYCGLLQSFEEADITNVAVAREARGRGVAQRMLDELMNLGRERGISRFTLEVRVGNAPAIHVYEKIGFLPSGIRKNFYQKPKEDALIMWTSDSQ